MSELTRRHFLSSSLASAPLIAWGPNVPLLLARAVNGERPRPGRVLVVVELFGGNDGLNTVVPCADEGYARARPSLRLPVHELIRLNGEVGLHPALRPLAAAWEAGKLAIVQGVGYANSTRSHFLSQAIWHTAETDPARHLGAGWLGRGLDAAAGRQGQAVFVGSGTVPVAVRGRQGACQSVDRPDAFRLAGGLPRRGPAALVPPGAPGNSGDLLVLARRTALAAAASADLFDAAQGHAAGAGYPASALGRRLQLTAGAIKSGLPASVYYLVQSGYDTHIRQLPDHAAVLGELAQGWRAFLDDLAAARLGDRVALVAVSEFGRRVAANASAGTDHGTAGPVLLAGVPVRGGLVGPTPRLGAADLDNGDLRVTVDFRQVYATVLRDWLGVNDGQILGRVFDRLPLFLA
jgi:uncharacterized protein (DUF1501 family)